MHAFNNLYNSLKVSKLTLHLSTYAKYFRTFYFEINISQIEKRLGYLKAYFAK